MIKLNKIRFLDLIDGKTRFYPEDHEIFFNMFPDGTFIATQNDGKVLGSEFFKPERSTGKRDINDKEIWEGDSVSFRVLEPGSTAIVRYGEVAYDIGEDEDEEPVTLPSVGFYIETKKYKYTLLEVENIEVIGAEIVKDNFEDSQIIGLDTNREDLTQHPQIHSNDPWQVKLSKRLYGYIHYIDPIERKIYIDSSVRDTERIGINCSIANFGITGMVYVYDSITILNKLIEFPIEYFSDDRLLIIKCPEDKVEHIRNIITTKGPIDLRTYKLKFETKDFIPANERFKRWKEIV